MAIRFPSGWKATDQSGASSVEGRSAVSAAPVPGAGASGARRSSALVLARVLWGFVGSRHARFADFFPTPGRLYRHFKALSQGQHPQYAGHNPLGALMMLALMAFVLGLGLTGWMQTTDAYFGEEWLMELHEWLANGLLIAAGLHGVAAIVMGRLERVNLVKAMVTGVKQPY